jgi:hypothetical protein
VLNSNESRGLDAQQARPSDQVKARSSTQALSDSVGVMPGMHLRGHSSSATRSDPIEKCPLLRCEFVFGK